LAAILPNPGRRSARHPDILVRRLAALYVERSETYGTLNTCVREPKNAQ